MFYRPMPDNVTRNINAFLENSGEKSDNIYHIGKMSETKAKPARLIIEVIAGRNLTSMDVGGKSDPYCIVTVGEQESKTTIEYNTVDPKWNANFNFYIYNGPHFQSTGSSDVEDSDIDQCILHYVIIDVWDKDTLNRDDFMGRIMIPVSLLSHESLCGWFSLGRTSVRDVRFTGEIYLQLRIKSQLPITRWSADEKLYKYCDELTGFKLPIQCTSAVVNFPGESERVEMVFENVVIEISKHRDVGTVYLTNYRLILICKSNDKVSEDHSMWIAFKNIQSVDKAVDEKAVRKSLSGNRRISVVKCLTIECCDFRKIRLTFVDFSQSTQPSISLMEMLKQSFLIPEFLPKRGEFGQQDTIVSSAPKFDALSGNDKESDEGDSWSLCEDDDVEEGQEIASEGMKPSIPQSSPRVIQRSFSPLSSLTEIGRMLINVPGVFSPNDTNTPPANESALKDDDGEVTFQKSFVQEYVNMFYVRLSYLILSVTEIPLSRKFVRAFPHSSSCGWDVYNVEEEFRRQKVDKNWRLSEMNQAFDTCQTYPRFLYVPAGVEDGILLKCAAFRSKGRLPVLCWFNKTKGNFIMRCAQPRTGPRKKFSVDDEYVIQTALASNTASRSLVIFDARSAIAASGNQLKGKGTEDVDRYPGCKLTFLNIPNIHAVRDSLEKLQTACQTSEKKWFSQLETSCWLAYISLILQGAISIVRHVDQKGIAALIHCSDGWDRTAQLSALAQILLDPFYRTIKGFQVLVEKEWVSFGHRFRDRNGHPSSNSNQRSPIFLQFLDCVWQILIQFPSSFEFTAEYLLKIVDHVNTGWFGTFMCNNEKERNEEAQSTVSLWAYLDNIQEVFTNENYIPDDEVLYPTSSLRRLLLWSDYFLRYDETFWAANQLFDYGLQIDCDETVNGQSVPETVVWVANERVKECHDCKIKFTHFNRRHHCRACGQIFCNECSSHRIHLLKLGYTKQERVCDRCYIRHRDEVDKCGNKESQNCDFGSFEVL